MSDFVPDGWKFVKLDDVAWETSDRVDNPSKSGYDRFVGLEHLNSGDLTVRRWGSTADLLSAMKLFKSGDILIGRRNAYLKRASKAEFDGVCSGDAYVVREKPGTIAEGLLPIILNSDRFWDYTIAHASGTMSKRAKWRDLAEYSFLLPTMEEQCRIATTLWAVEDCIVKGERLLAAAERAKQVIMGKLFSEGIGNKAFRNFMGYTKLPTNWKITNIGEICTIKYGISDEIDTSLKTGIPTITLQCVSSKCELSLKKDLIVYSSEERVNEDDYLKEGDVLFNWRNGSKHHLGKVAFIDFEKKYTHVGFLLRIRCITEFYLPKFLYYHLSYLKSIGYFLNAKNQINNTFNKSELSSVKVLLPPLPEQRQIAGILTWCDETIAAARANVMAAKALKMKMINEMLSPEN